MLGNSCRIGSEFKKIKTIAGVGLALRTEHQTRMAGAKTAGTKEICLACACTAYFPATCMKLHDIYFSRNVAGSPDCIVLTQPSVQIQYYYTIVCTNTVHNNST
jgi:hypothetical protein